MITSEKQIDKYLERAKDRKLYRTSSDRSLARFNKGVFMMKKLIFSSLSALLLLTSTSTAINAQEDADSEARIEQGEEYTEKRMPAFALVSAAYRGRYEDWDIPGYTTLETEYEAGNISAQDLVDAGVDAGELSPQAADDNEYVSFVDNELGALFEE